MEIKFLSNEKKSAGFTTKVIILGFLVLALMIPLEIIKSTIRERKQLGNEAIKSIEDQWGGKQTVSGLVLNIPYLETSSIEGVKPKERILHILPTELNAKVKLEPEERYRSIYKTVVYNAEVNLEGQFKKLPLSPQSTRTYHTKKAYLSLGVSENRGFKGPINLLVNQEKVTVEPGLPDTELFSSGVHANTPLENSTKIQFSMQFTLSGSKSFQLLPVGKTSDVSIQSVWTDPSFSGNHLPINREITKEGFDAQWQVTDLNRNYPQSWSGKKYSIYKSAFGVDLFLPVDHYQLAHRSTKYGLLFIILTFLVLVFTEISTQTRIHFFNYLLVAVALILFFLLLTSISEQIGFSLAYLISSLAIVILISLFTKSVTGFTNVALRSLLVLSGLYSFMFILLQMKEYAFLAGNIGLFIILIVIMYVSAKYKTTNLEEKHES